MKRPYSPSDVSNPELDSRNFSRPDVRMDEDASSDGQAEGAGRGQRSTGPPAPPKPRREGRQRRYTVCEVCNIQLNSAAQAQIHYNGKSHQKRLKHVGNGKVSAHTGREALSSQSAASHIHTHTHSPMYTHTLYCPTASAYV